MQFRALVAFFLAVLAQQATAHYTFPTAVAGGVTSGQWQYIRMTDNHYSNGPVTDVKSAAMTCYTTQNLQAASTVNVAAGSTLGIVSGGTISHPGTLNVYMAKAPGDINSFDGSGSVWFKVYEIRPVTNGGSSITFPSQGLAGFSFTIPKSLPSGQYLVRTEHIALHSAGTSGGAQIYISCAQINVTGGGSGKPGPLVAIPGVYTGNEPGILINIYYPVPATYTQPGPAVWTG